MKRHDASGEIRFSVSRTSLQPKLHGHILAHSFHLARSRSPDFTAAGAMPDEHAFSKQLFVSWHAFVDYFLAKKKVATSKLKNYPQQKSK